MTRETGAGAGNERELAFRALSSFRRKGVFAPELPDPERDGPGRRAAALVTRITRGVLRNMALCDFYIESFSSLPARKIEPQVLDILRLSAYQMIFLGKIPVSAAVNEGVTLARRHANPRAAGFVNAVLRRLADSLDDLPEPRRASRHEMLAIRYSHPKWLVSEFDSALGGAGLEELLAANNEQPPLTVRVNTLKTDAEAAARSLEAQGLRAERRVSPPGSLDLRGGGNPGDMNALRDGHVFVQDASSTLAALAASPSPGDKVLDGCAAPGGKSFAAAIEMKNTGAITSRDVSADRLTLVESGARRLGVTIIRTCPADARVCADADSAGSMDIVYADVPCSGFGVIRRKPEIRYKDPEKLRSLRDAQLDILSCLSTYVKPGGRLIYSTCTVFRRENEDIVEEFLRRRGGFYAEPFALPGDLAAAPDGMVTLWPHIHGTDGFFICRLRRSS
ncbi:MAG: 16S rRNA (cytosine(967)-C(5))-methyltransferase RsmB [Oscillospiraceae bacterium]|jgi:16S rRNA (cytosine967-C5)-methyltransferase|nr:16S rRNA (cytosine(967)-C(5))-methyltransferase RsmB [Oscillospiraceae bacterium]